MRLKKYRLNKKPLFWWLRSDHTIENNVIACIPNSIRYIDSEYIYIRKQWYCSNMSIIDIKTNLLNKIIYWWIRSPHRLYDGCVCDIYMDSTIDYSNVEYSEGITPICII